MVKGMSHNIFDRKPKPVCKSAPGWMRKGFWCVTDVQCTVATKMATGCSNPEGKKYDN